jgi:hypothetical protein
VELWFVLQGALHPPRRITFEVVEGKPVSLDQKLREAVNIVAPTPQSMRERQEYLALLARWYYSSWRDGEWFAFDSLEHLPYRKLVHAISRTAQKVG